MKFRAKPATRFFRAHLNDILRDPWVQGRDERLRWLTKTVGAKPYREQGVLKAYDLPNGDRVCLKVAMFSKEEAFKALAQCQSEARKSSRRKENGAYCCPVCGCWHLTSKA